jgi:hypothetical protein
MERRIAIKQLIVIAGGAMLIPSCVRDTKQVTVDLNNLKLSVDQVSLLEEVTETIIPGTDTPGARDMDLHRFVLKMVDDCSEPDQQKRFVTGLSEVDALAESKFGRGFKDLNKADRESLIRSLDEVGSSDQQEEKEKPLHTFYAMTKDLTIRGYMSSEFVMTNQLYYTMIPGRFDGCVEIKDAKDYKTILG